ncbi:hypothetical protein HK096_011160 [Nowakowskiella sp. JEL0078]|nr:hypothetical protein HK096_011160 [Nowakowskiella sp. JEL0078]
MGAATSHHFTDSNLIKTEKQATATEKLAETNFHNSLETSINVLEGVPEITSISSELNTNDCLENNNDKVKNNQMNIQLKLLESQLIEMDTMRKKVIQKNESLESRITEISAYLSQSDEEKRDLKSLV